MPVVYEYEYMIHYKIKYPHRAGEPIWGEGTTSVQRDRPIRDMIDVEIMQADILNRVRRQYPSAENVMVVGWYRFGQ